MGPGTTRGRTAATAIGVATTILLSSAGQAAAEPIQKPQRAQMRHFGFFHTAPEGLSGWQPPLEEAGPKAPYLRGCTGLNAQLAQKVEGIPGRRIFVIPGDGCMELVNEGPVEHPFPVLAGITPTEEAIKHGMGTGGFRVGFGVVPDGVIAVRLSPTLSAPVISGTFYTFSYRGLDIESLWRKPRLVFGASVTGG
jgi:hypothetical protein